MIAHLRAVGAALDVPVAILQDLTGPKVRVGTFATGTVELVTGHLFTLTTRPVEGSPDCVSVSYSGLPDEVDAGDALLLADGTIELRVSRVAGSDIDCEVVVGGRLSSRKGITVPAGLARLPILSEKDLRDLRFGLERGVD